MASNEQPKPSECPVDHKSREVWLKAAQQQQRPEGKESSSIDATPSTSSSNKRPRFTDNRTAPSLSTEREVSSIPRGSFTSPPTSSAPSASQSPSETTTMTASHCQPQSESPNAETAQPLTSPTGHWLYPSESQFFTAITRKHGPPTSGTSARPTDMRTVIPMHNAINERTWQHILMWERGKGGEKCGGPKLVSFSGDSTKLTPRARWLGLLGYTRPFDRHDWVVERCGTKVEYVIDFYQGRDTGAKQGAVNFYLDVRPKLNTWEGWRMRIGRFFGY